MSEESLINILDGKLSSEYSLENDTQIKRIKEDAIKKLNCEKIVTVIDSSLEVEGSLFWFCKERGYEVESIQFFSAITLSDRDLAYNDPYVACGYFLIKKGDFRFVIHSDFDTSGVFEKIVSINVVPENQYSEYLSFKVQYRQWQKEKFGVIVSVAGGEDYVVLGKKQEDLFYGEHSKLVSAIFDDIDSFLNSEEFYLKNDLPWKLALYVEGASGSGRSDLVNSIIAKFDVAPIAINPFNCDDSVLVSVSNLASSIRKSFLLLEDVDVLIEEGFVSVQAINQLIDDYSSKNGVIIICTCSKKNALDKILFRFDKVIKIPQPEYKESVKNLFGDFLTKKNLTEFSKELENNEIPYKYMKKIRDLFVVSNIKAIKEEKPIRDSIGILKAILLTIKAETVALDKKRSKSVKVGLLKGRE